jgi:prephenate dehydrogenase
LIARLGVVGLGLLGGSVAKAALVRGVAQEVVGFDVNPTTAATAKALAIVSRVADSVDSLAAQVDVVILATPVGTMRSLLTILAAHERPWFMDVGSTKQSVISEATAALGKGIERFIPAHPIAGGERSGPEAARDDLFVGRHAILTPLPANAPELLVSARTFWTQLGASVIEMSAAQHDAIFSAVSHVPHLASFALVAHYADRSDGPLLFKHAGGGFRDFARISGSSPVMWRDIALANKAAVLPDLDRYIDALQAMRHAIADGDGPYLTDTMTRARSMRARWLAGEFDTPAD